MEIRLSYWAGGQVTRSGICKMLLRGVKNPKSYSRKALITKPTEFSQYPMPLSPSVSFLWSQSGEAVYDYAVADLLCDFAFQQD